MGIFVEPPTSTTCVRSRGLVPLSRSTTRTGSAMRLSRPPESWTSCFCVSSIAPESSCVRTATIVFCSWLRWRFAASDARRIACCIARGCDLKGCMPFVSQNCCAIRRSKSLPPSCASPLTATISTTFSKQSTSDTSSVPPPKS